MDNTGMSLKDKTLSGTVWSFADSILGQGVTFIVGLFLARLLSPYEFGLIGIVTIFIAVFNSMVDSGFSNALIRKIDAVDLDFNTVFISNLIVSFVLFVLFYLGVPYVSLFFNQPILTPLCRVMSLIIIINAFAIIQRTIFVKRVDFKTQAKASLISSVTSGGIGILMAHYGYGVWALAGQQLTRQLLNTILLWIYGQWLPKLQFSVASFKELFGFGWKLLVTGLIETIWNEIYQIVIGKCYSSVTLGYYTRAQQFANLPSSNLTSVIQRVTYPIFSSIQDDKLRLKQAYRHVIKDTMLVTFACMMGMVAVAKPLVVVLIGEQWLPAVPFLQIICFNYMLYPLHALNLNMLQVQGRSDLYLKLGLIKKAIALGPVLLGIYMNIYWMLIGGVVAGFLAYYLNAYYSGKFLHYNTAEQLKDVLPAFIVAIFMAVCIYMFTFLSLSYFTLLLLQVCCGVAIFFFVTHLLKFDEVVEMKNLFLSFLKRKGLSFLE